MHAHNMEICTRIEVLSAFSLCINALNQPPKKQQHAWVRYLLYNKNLGTNLTSLFSSKKILMEAPPHPLPSWVRETIPETSVRACQEPQPRASFPLSNPPDHTIPEAALGERSWQSGKAEITCHYAAPVPRCSGDGGAPCHTRGGSNSAGLSMKCVGFKS